LSGEGGVRPGEPDFLRGTQEICRQRGALLILDEVQTGFGRTGKMFAHQHYALQPDLLCLAKSIAGGLPMGATLLADHLGSLPSQSHGSTFGGNRWSARSWQPGDRSTMPSRAAELGAWFMSS
jgi:acetylornithine/LysW-gamma-L-lysine aminotransferase